MLGIVMGRKHLKESGGFAFLLKVTKSTLFFSVKGTFHFFACMLSNSGAASCSLVCVLL